MPRRRPPRERSPVSATANSPVPLLRHHRDSDISSLESAPPSRGLVRPGPIRSNSIQIYHDNPFSDRPNQPQQINRYKYFLPPDPSQWGYDVSPKSIDADDWLHKPDKNLNDTGSIWNTRGIPTIGCILVLILCLLGLFLGFPVQDAIRKHWLPTNGGYNLGGINATGQIMEGSFSLIDNATPQDARTKVSPVDGRTMQLVFSDEFEQDGRTFWPGDDPFWEAADQYYWNTQDLEYYDPQQVYTKGGKLVFEFKEATPSENHNLSYTGGMLTSWNKFCFTGGLIEASVQLPGSPHIKGFWPAIWTMGNLGRAGFGATTDGLWPYSYEACDIGTMPNQTQNGFPDAIGEQLGDPYAGYRISEQPGQRLSSCTCPGEPHPGPVHRDGSFTARGAPEIDIFEGQIDDDLEGGSVSQSSQFAPFNAYYHYDNQTHTTFYQTGDQHFNTYSGGAYQQAGSVVSKTNWGCYQTPAPGYTQCYTTLGFQYKPGFGSDGGHITWINDDQRSWDLDIAGFGSDQLTGISPRMVSKEPMYIIMNLGMSESFSYGIPFDQLTFPAYMKVDWIRIYQYQEDFNVGCDPADHPTSNYINTFIEAYTNPNITRWSTSPDQGGYDQKWPQNSLVTPCS